MIYLKKYEEKSTENINKIYYVWKLPYKINNYDFDRYAVIEILKVSKDIIRYRAINRTDWRGEDFFTSETVENLKFGNLVNMSIWKKMESDGILFKSNNLNDAKLFLSLKLNKKDINQNNFELYKNIDKYNI